MSPNVMVTPPRPARTRRSELLRRFLQAYWLRPENALWMTMRSEVLAPYTFEHPSADVSCGDGIFSFLHAGGVLHPAFDVFGVVSKTDRVGDERADMFNHVSDDYRPEILSPPDYRVDVGTDVKQALLTKAQRLGFYDRLIRNDNNRPLPFGDETFRTIYCNSAYWVADIDGFLMELRRITRAGGRIILQVKLDSLRRYTLTRHSEALGDRFLEILARGRLQSWPTLASRSVWESRFAGAGLMVEDATPFVTGTHAHIWDVGLRPIAPLLVKMANALTPQTRTAVKREWVNLFRELLEPICNPELDLFAQAGEPAEIQYVLTNP